MKTDVFPSPSILRIAVLRLGLEDSSHTRHASVFVISSPVLIEVR